MSPAFDPKRAAIDRNLSRFSELLPGLRAEHEGSYALLRHGEILGFYANALDAQIAGNQRFEDGVFSIQHVTETAEGLGYFTYAVHQREARKH